MKYKLMLVMLLGIFLIGLVLAISATECQDQTDRANSPCNVITPILNIGTTDCNATVLDLNTPAINYTTNLSINGDQTYNFTFNYTNISIYSITLDCHNYSATIDVNNWDEDYNDKWLYFYGTSILMGFGLFIWGFKSENNLLCLLGGFMFLAFAIFFTSQGYPTLNEHNTMRMSIILISFGVGLYITGQSTIHLLTEGV